MISVPNHRQPLSGNKLLLSALTIIALALSSCSTTSRTSGSKHPDTIQTKMDTVQPVRDPRSSSTDVKNAVALKPDTIKPDAIGKYWVKKDTYNIALILPFSTDESELDKLLGEENITGYQPLASIEFYEGALLALDTLKKLGVNLNVTVYDHKKDSSLTSVVMHREDIKKMDLLIGPVFNEGIKAAVDITRDNEIYFVSPLSPAGISSGNNPYFIMANAPVSAQIHALLAYTLAENPQANIILVSRTDKPNEVKIASEFKKEFNLLNAHATLREAANISGVSDALATSGNFVFIASMDEFYVNGLVRDLSKITRENSITLLGLQYITTMESISLDYYENLHLHYPTSYWVDPYDPKVKNFNSVFASKYEIRPSDFAYRGYDLLLYFGMMLKSYGPDIVKDLAQPNLAGAQMLYPYTFAPCLNDAEEIKFIENDNITILKYENYRFGKVTTQE